jgi:hypothetical protein
MPKYPKRETFTKFPKKGRGTLRNFPQDKADAL